MNALAAIMTREAKIRATNLLFIFWDLLYPLGYLLVFGVGINASLGFSSAVAGVDYNAFFLAGVLAMALAAHNRVLRLEINGASLEDIFIELTQKGAPS